MDEQVNIHTVTRDTIIADVGDFFLHNGVRLQIIAEYWTDEEKFVIMTLEHEMNGDYIGYSLNVPLTSRQIAQVKHVLKSCAKQIA